MSYPVVITRHPALVELLIERGVVQPGIFTLIEHATLEDIRGRHVIGVLPFDMAAEALSITLIPLTLEPEDRGKELTIERLREIAADQPRSYVVLPTGATPPGRLEVFWRRDGAIDVGIGLHELEPGIFEFQHGQAIQVEVAGPVWGSDDE